MSYILVIIVIILLILCIILYNSKYAENFGLFIQDIIIPKQCYNYLVTDGIKYYLLNTRKIFDGVINPREFTSSDLAYKYLDKIGCPRMDITDLVVKKSKDDPQETLERTCAKIVASNIFNKDVCATYNTDVWNGSPEALGTDMNNINVWDSVAKKLGLTPNDKASYENVAKTSGIDLNAMTGIDIVGFVKMYQEKAEANKQYTDYNIESCMIKMAAKNWVGNDDPKFKSQFENYFKQLNDTIPENLIIST